MSRFIIRLLVPASLLLFAQCGTKITEAQKASPVIHLQPFAGMPGREVTQLYDGLKKIFPDLVIRPAIPFPANAWYAPNKRYRADSLIRYLAGLTLPGHVSIGITDKDISTQKGKIKDYGIMGLGYRPGSACVVSPFRLSKKNTQQQLLKLALHELGHTQGLEHCPEKTCFMRDAEGKNHTDEEKEFCPPCKNRLLAKGWRL